MEFVGACLLRLESGLKVGEGRSGGEFGSCITDGYNDESAKFREETETRKQWRVAAFGEQRHDVALVFYSLRPVDQQSEMSSTEACLVRARSRNPSQVPCMAPDIRPLCHTLIPSPGKCLFLLTTCATERLVDHGRMHPQG